MFLLKWVGAGVDEAIVGTTEATGRAAGLRPRAWVCHNHVCGSGDPEGV